MNISSDHKLPLVAVAKSTSYKNVAGLLAIFDLESKVVKVEFPVRYDFGGRRLSLGRDAQCCFVGCYEHHGLAAYLSVNGSELWRRGDLDAVQRVNALPFEDAVFCGRARGKEGHLVCAKSGRTLEKLGEVETIYTSPLSQHAVLGGKKLDLHSSFGTRVGSIKRATFAELDCCFSETELAVTESGGPVRCFDLASLQLLWTHKPKKGSHFIRLAYSQALDRFVGIWWHYEDDSDPTQRIVQLDRRSGKVMKEVRLGQPGQAEFCLSGTAVFTSELRLVDVTTGKTINEFVLGDK